MNTDAAEATGATAAAAASPVAPVFATIIVVVVPMTAVPPAAATSPNQTLHFCLKSHSHWQSQS